MFLVAPKKIFFVSNLPLPVALLPFRNNQVRINKIRKILPKQSGVDWLMVGCLPVFTTLASFVLLFPTMGFTTSVD